MATQLDDEQLAVLKKVEKLLRLAGSNENAEEAASAAAKAQELLLAYNLDASAIGGADADGQRGKEKLDGGFYEYERNLWTMLAETNFCLYWNQRDWIDRPENEQLHAKVLKMRSYFRQRHIQVRRHHLVGKKVSVMTTKFMAEYLLGTIERLTREFIASDCRTDAEGRIVGLGAALRSRRATSYREGIAATLVDKLWDRRHEQIAEERKAARKAEMAQADAMAKGASSATALTIASVQQSEHDANMDVLYGEGYSAKQRAQAAARAAARKAADEEYTRWAAAHPEEAKKQAEEARKEERKRSNRRYSGGAGSRGGATKEDLRDHGAYNAGRVKGQEIGLDPQTSNANAQRKIGHG